ncbi:MAG: LysR family transcriptional regulator [Bacilli bacterium]|jgi:DNA-binding transcriptional LysR family regulator|nr:LysR family transcriptional regulator [Bacilli bacterium]
MDIRHLNYFVQVVENDFNLSRTSQKLQITQPTLSQMIVGIENEYGVKIFDKEFGRYRGLTKEGTKLYNDAKLILNKMEQLNYEMKQSSKIFKGRVRIGIPPLILTFLCLKSVPKFYNDNTNVRLDIVEDSVENLIEKLERNEIDLAIITNPIESKNIILKPIVKDRIACFVGKDHPFASKASVSLNDIANEKIMMLDDTHIISQRIHKLFRANDLNPDYYFKSGQWELLVNMASYVNGVALLPNPLDVAMPKNVVAIDIVPALKWEIVIAYNQNIVKSPDTRYVENFFEMFYNDKANDKDVEMK